MLVLTADSKSVSLTKAQHILALSSMRYAPDFALSSNTFTHWSELQCTDCADDGLGIIAQFWNKLAGDDSGDVIYGDWVFA